MRDDEESEHLTARLARIDERVRNLSDTLATLRTQIQRDFAEFVRLARFRPIELTVYGLVALLLGGIFTALLAKIIH